MEEQRRRNFGRKLRELRLNHETESGGGVTLQRLAEISHVDYALISAVERGTRRVGEISLRKLAAALDLDEKGTESFVLEGLTAAGSNQILEEAKDFPVHFLHAIAREIRLAFPDQDPGEIDEVVYHPASRENYSPDLMWSNKEGEWFALEISLAKGRNPTEAVSKLKRKINWKK